MIGMFLNDTRGTSAIEYVVVAAGIALGLVAAVQALGVDVTGLFEAVAAGF